MFKKLKFLVERQSGHKLKVLKTNAEGEYVSIDNGRFCDQEGIVHEVRPPYTPQKKWCGRKSYGEKRNLQLPIFEYVPYKEAGKCNPEGSMVGVQAKSEPFERIWFHCIPTCSGST